MYINCMHHKKKSPNNSTHNVSFETYMQFFELCDKYHFVKKNPYIKVYHYLLYFKEID
jgi:hypothetical protein